MSAFILSTEKMASALDKEIQRVAIHSFWALSYLHLNIYIILDRHAFKNPFTAKRSLPRRGQSMHFKFEDFFS